MLHLWGKRSGDCITIREIQDENYGLISENGNHGQLRI